jgi:spore coat protein A
LLDGRVIAQSDEETPNILWGVPLEPFVDPLPLPPVLRPVRSKEGGLMCQLVMTEFRQKLHRDLEPTWVWGFNGISPGPTISAFRDEPLTVDWLNRLPSRHRLAVDHTLHGAGANVPEVRTTIHLHGGHVAAKDDGYPEDWITPGNRQRTYYPNRQVAASLWYHDHAMGITRLNAMMGLAGMYVLRERGEAALGLPAGRYEIPLVLQDRILDAGGQLAYPVGPSADAPWAPEFFGTHILVNGRVSPYLEVEPARYRFRILNASNARIFQMVLAPEQPFFQVGSDGGLLREPVTRHELLIAPGERADVIVDFQGRAGRRLMLVNYGRAPYPSGGAPVPGMVLQFRVSRTLSDAPASRELPGRLARVDQIPESAAQKTRRLILMEEIGPGGRVQRTLLDGKRFMDPITEDPSHGTTEIWEFLNTTMDTHPIHLHAVHFQVLGRRAFDMRRWQATSETVFTGREIQAPREEQGWKDMVICPPGQLTRIIVPFSGEPGKYVWHCHMLEHEDNEMMRPFNLL